jgi:DNA-binding MarR family transcriptional regulator
MTAQAQSRMKGSNLNENLHPYVVFLPSEEKTRILSSIFGSKASVDILRFSLDQGISHKIYQKDLVKKLNYSNKTVIENSKSLTKLGILVESMEKMEREDRIVWVKTYQLSNVGKWFALLLAEEKEIAEDEKAEILQNLFRSYVKWVRDLARKLHVEKKTLVRIFDEEMK